MKSRNIGEIFKNAAGTVFLLAAAFFVCSTFLSMRAVFADPVAPQMAPSAQSPRATSSRTTRSTARVETANRAGGTAAPAASAAAGRSVAGRANASAASAAAARSQSDGRTTNRGVVARTGRTGGATTRSVVSRAATDAPANAARVSLTGTAIRGGKATTSYTYLSNKLYTGNYSNIIDPTTGLISAEAYTNCVESYYTCMDEICTARNAAQRRCACAGRVRGFADAEAKLTSANNELIKASGELALLIATKGKDISSAFQLTDAEKVMNCVSWRDESTTNPNWDTAKSGETFTEKQKWCQNHMMGTDSSSCNKPSYCTAANNNFGFDVDNLDGSSSDILASLKSWAEAKEKTITITNNDNSNLLLNLGNISGIVSGMTGVNTSMLNADSIAKDSLAETWGYDLFKYAHNNVCNRVLDSCFNGIYEACGTPAHGMKCSTGAPTCPYNYNTVITVDNTGTSNPEFLMPGANTATNTAACFGYNNVGGDPYSNLRGPVADARRSVLQKYALDANADCDAYGEQLRTTAQNIGYQKAAAQQALQKKRLEFVQEEERTTLADASQAATNFSGCISELYECYTTQDDANKGRSAKWTTERIKTYCATIANVPSCYNTMICNPSSNQFRAVVDVADETSCDSRLAASTASTKACRNVVMLNEILNGTGTTASKPSSTTGIDSAAFRAYCINTAIGPGPSNQNTSNAIQEWKATP
jgi:hypothetical protein